MKTKLNGFSTLMFVFVVQITFGRKEQHVE